MAIDPLAVQGAGYALVVGVNDCPDFRLSDSSKPRPLRGAETDADNVAEALQSIYGLPATNIVLLKGSDATRQAIERAFSRVAERAGSGDSVIFHFSGHGTQLPDRKPFDEKDGLEEALCPFDATEAGNGLILDDDLGRWLERLQVAHITVILDCCHAGTGIKDLDDDVMPRFLPIKIAERPLEKDMAPWRDVRPQSKSINRRLTAFFACRPEQQAYERRLLDFAPPVRAGQFTAYLLGGLRDSAADRNRDGLVSNQELIEYATQRLDEGFNQHRSEPAARQQPQLESDFPDAHVFGLPRAQNP